MSITKLAWTWRQPAIHQASASAERMRGRIIVGMLTGEDPILDVHGGTGRSEPAKK
jgi:hypothetical protein